MKNTYFLLLLILFINSCISEVQIPPEYKLLEEGKEFYIEHDNFNGTSFIKHKSTFPYIIESLNRRFFRLYIAEKNDFYALRIKFVYRSDNWIFFDSIIIMNENGVKIRWDGLKSWDKTTDVVTGGGVYESIDLILSTERINLIESVLMGSEITCRFSGKYIYDVILDNSIRLGALQTISLFKTMN